MRTKPKYKYNSPKAKNVNLSDTDKHKIYALLDSHPNADEFIEQFKKIYSEYKIFEKDDPAYSQGRPSPTAKKVAAEDISNDIRKLLPKLSKMAGGLKPDFDHALSVSMRNRTKVFHLADLIHALRETELECQRYIRYKYPVHLATKKFSAKEVFAEELAKLFHSVLNEPPKNYIPDDLSINLPLEKREGRFARLLVLAFGTSSSLKSVVDGVLKK